MVRGKTEGAEKGPKVYKIVHFSAKPAGGFGGGEKKRVFFEKKRDFAKKIPVFRGKISLTGFAGFPAVGGNGPSAEA